MGLLKSLKITSSSKKRKTSQQIGAAESPKVSSELSPDSFGDDLKTTVLPVHTKSAPQFGGGYVSDSAEPNTPTTTSLAEGGRLSTSISEPSTLQQARSRPRRIIVPIDLGLPEHPEEYSKPGEITVSEKRLASLPKEIWGLIADMLPPSSAANLALTCRTLRHKLGAQHWIALNEAENRQHKIDFLFDMDRHLPDHLLCFLCGTYHARLQPGAERLKQNLISSPIFDCPRRRQQAYPRARLTHGRELPFAFVQLALRGYKHTPSHGVDLPSLSRTWHCRDSTWTHKTRFHIHENGHLFMRVTSVSPAPPAMTPNQERLLLFSRSDYAPYFSVCAHWSNYNLIPICKCALSHVPEPPQSLITQLRQHPSFSLAKLNSHLLPKQCDECKPLRRCPECPTEYLVHLKLIEDKNDAENQFKQAISVTRWSDLGDGRSPASPEWAACAGEGDKFDSAGAVGAAALCSLFEAAVSRGAPGERLAWLQRGGIINGKMQDVY